jgi:hypothetical protein
VCDGGGIYYQLELKTDINPRDLTWEITSSNGNVVANGGDFDQPDLIYTSNGCLPAKDCYELSIYDSYGDGLCCTGGAGYFMLYVDFVLAWTGAVFGDKATSPTMGKCPE